jgi:hypothetical protein
MPSEVSSNPGKIALNYPFSTINYQLFCGFYGKTTAEIIDNG